MKNSLDAFWMLLKKNSGRIFYYGGVAIVLAAIAFAAESYLQSEPEELVAPTAEVSALLERIGKPELLCPEGMQLLRGFSAQPEWNAELRQWESHEAMDYSLKDDEVLCLQDGIVQAVGESGRCGGFVEVECGGRSYVYASLLPDAAILPGMEIKAGDSIGKADNAMPGEQELGAHLHLEIFEDGKATDFESLCAKIDA